MLNVNSTSSASGGSGSTIIASIASRPTGRPMRFSSMLRKRAAPFWHGCGGGAPSGWARVRPAASAEPFDRGRSPVAAARALRCGGASAPAAAGAYT
jgi:hypothetical protein